MFTCCRAAGDVPEPDFIVARRDKLAIRADGHGGDNVAMTLSESSSLPEATSQTLTSVVVAP